MPAVNRGATLRLHGGALRGRLLRVPPEARPTEGRVREALGSIWCDRLPGAQVLDLFAGSGAVAFEALSRGAAFALLVDSSEGAIAAQRANARDLGVAERCRVQRLDLRLDPAAAIARIAGSFDLIFVDPPYAFADWDRLMALVSGLLAPSGEAAIEHSRRIDLRETYGELGSSRRRDYGESSLSFFVRCWPQPAVEGAGPTG